MWLLLALACSDYKISSKPDVDPVGEDTGEYTPPVDTDTGEPLPDHETADTAEPGDDEPPFPVDTEDTAPPEDTDTGEPEEEPAPEPIYVNSGQLLYSFDPETATITEIGPFMHGGDAISTMTDIAIDLSGRMFGITYESLWRINPLTGDCTHIADLGEDVYLDSLTFVSDGRLISAGNGEVWVMDESTAQLSSLSFTTEYSSAGDIVGLPDGLLYWSVWDAGLLVVDPSNGTNTYLGSTNYDRIFGMGYAYGDLWAFTGNGEALILDTEDGAPMEVHSVGESWWGATTNPVLW